MKRRFKNFLEKNWAVNLSSEDAVRLTVKALLEVVDSGSKNMEVAMITFGNPVRLLPEEELQTIIGDIEREQEEAKKSAQESNAMDT